MLNRNMHIVSTAYVLFKVYNINIIMREGDYY